MSEKNQIDIEKEDSESSKPEYQESSGLGDYLRSEREKRGISFDEMAGIIRIRKRFLEALENEQWDDLPSPVFVKGFIRSYTKALEIERHRALELYEKNAISEDEPPRPLVEPKKSTKKLILYPLIVLGIVAILLYLLITPEPVKVVSERLDSPAVEERDTSEVVEVSEQEKQDELPSEEEDTKTDDIIVSDPIIEEEHKAEEIVDINGNQTQTSTITSDNLPAVEQDEPNNLLVLTGIINMRTYIKIYIDDELPKEYIFEPGSRPQWKAIEGFDVLVGNAAGVELNYNGEKIDNLGGLGKVVRVRLPEGFESSLYED